MLERLLLAGAAASVAVLPGLPAGAAESPDGPGSTAPTDDDAEQHCVMFTVRTDRGSVVDESTLQCYDTLAAAVTRRGQMRAGFTIATHYENANGGGTSVSIQGDSCTATWAPGSWWRANLSSTRLGMTCSGAKHYTGTNCGGSYQIATAVYPTFTNLGSALNDNVGCVKYA